MMINRRLNGPDSARTCLRSAVMAVESEMCSLKLASTDDILLRKDRLIENWQQLVSLLLTPA